MAFKYSDIELLFDLVNAGPYGANDGCLCPESSTTHFHTDFGDNFEELPEDIADGDKYISVPHKNDLELGQNLVFEFVSENLPDDYEEVRQMFRKRGAYSKYKSLLIDKGLLDQWHEYENNATEHALREWLELEGIELVD